MDFKTLIFSFHFTYFFFEEDCGLGTGNETIGPCCSACTPSLLPGPATPRWAWHGCEIHVHLGVGSLSMRLQAHSLIYDVVHFESPFEL